MQDNTRGALLMMGSMACFVVNDACMKAVGDRLPLFQILVIRGVATSVMIWLLARSLGALTCRLSRYDWGLVLLRTACEAGAAYFFLTALFNMPLANATAILQVLPLTVTLGAALFLRERIGWRRMLAIGLGFAGMLLIVRPGPEGFSLYSIYALLAVLCVTARDLVVRRMSRDVPSMTVALIGALGVLVFAIVGSLTVTWQPVSWADAGFLAGASVFVLGGYVFSVWVMRVGEVSFVAPFRYTSLIWALLIGLFMFQDWPDSITLTGAAIVVGSGVFTLLRTRQVNEAARTATR